MSTPTSLCHWRRNTGHISTASFWSTMRLTFILTATLSLVLSRVATADVTLIADGQSRCAILVDPAVMAAGKKLPAKSRGPDAEAETQRQRLQESVNDLALYLQKMSGAKVD